MNATRSSVRTALEQERRSLRNRISHLQGKLANVEAELAELVREEGLGPWGEAEQGYFVLIPYGDDWAIFARAASLAAARDHARRAIEQGHVVRLVSRRVVETDHEIDTEED
jgi:hypothetical protein